jgi:hypothetical protein
VGVFDQLMSAPAPVQEAGIALNWYTSTKLHINWNESTDYSLVVAIDVSA